MKKAFLSLLIFIAIAYLCRSQTAGFTPTKIDASTFLATPDPRWQTPEQNIAPLLDQPFRFLGAGAQTYAFESEDGTIVLKFIKQSHRRPLPWLAKLRLPSFLEPWRSHIIEKRRRHLHNLMKSCYVARTILPEETGVFYAHFQKTNALEGKKVTLIDNIGIAHKILINETLFVLQDKVDLLLHDLNQGRIEAMIDLTHRQCQKGIANSDMAFNRNFGFKGDKAISLDIGSFHINPRLKEPGKCKEEFLIELLPLRDILFKEHPHLLETFDDKVTSILRS